MVVAILPANEPSSSTGKATDSPPPSSSLQAPASSTLFSCAHPPPTPRPSAALAATSALRNPPFAEVSAATLANDPRRPQYHLLPARNWMNDPNGPIFWRGQYHMFSSTIPTPPSGATCTGATPSAPTWSTGATSPSPSRPPPAAPTPPDVLTGSALPDGDRVAILYAGVAAAPLKEATIRDGGPQPFRESQCLAFSSGDLTHGPKSPRPVIPAPPPGLDVTGFRDPAPWRQGDDWYVAIGSGIRGKGGAVLLYRSSDLRHWDYLHPLAQGFGQRPGRRRSRRRRRYVGVPRLLPPRRPPRPHPLHPRPGVLAVRPPRSRRPCSSTPSAAASSTPAPTTRPKPSSTPTAAASSGAGSRNAAPKRTTAPPDGPASCPSPASSPSTPMTISSSSCPRGRGPPRSRTAPPPHRRRNRGPRPARPPANPQRLRRDRPAPSAAPPTRSPSPSSHRGGPAHPRNPGSPAAGTPRHPDTLLIEDQPVPLGADPDPEVELRFYIDGSVIESFANRHGAFTQRFYCKARPPRPSPSRSTPASKTSPPSPSAR